MRYFELCGISATVELEAFLYGPLEAGIHHHHVITHALNTRFVGRRGSHPVPYLEDGP
jgi:hypothetical protein